MSVMVDYIDVEQMLIDNAKLTKRVAELEDNQEKIVKFLKARFPKHANKLKGLLREQLTNKKPVKPATAFNQDDFGLSTERAIIQCFTAKPVSVDPIEVQAGIYSSKKKTELSDSLGW